MPGNGSGVGGDKYNQQCQMWKIIKSAALQGHKI